MAQALYRSYRSKSLKEVVGQDHITKTLAKAIKSGRISHAYLFTGPRGVGKTSVARILAHMVNDIPYTGEDIHLDIIEIDAASNRRIDEIRDLRDKVHIAPTSSKYKVYIIDEVHMLTREAFNALLKTLEEPPAHCIFILATTEAHKLPETIVSRTQKFNFRSISTANLVDHLSTIAKQEKINITPQALTAIAEQSEGSFRDAISLLDQLSGVADKITGETVRQQLGLPQSEYLEALYESIKSGDLKRLMQNLNQAREQAIDAAITAKSLSNFIRSKISTGSLDQDDIKLIKDLLIVNGAANADDLLEITLLSAAANNLPSPPKPTAGPKVSELKPEIKKEKLPKTDIKSTESKVVSDKFDNAMWEDVLKVVKLKAPALYTALRLSQPEIADDKLILYFEFSLHQKKVNTTEYRDVVSAAVESVCGQAYIVQCQVDKDRVAAANAASSSDFYKASESQPAVAAISNIFGGAEVLES